MARKYYRIRRRGTVTVLTLIRTLDVYVSGRPFRDDDATSIISQVLLLEQLDNSPHLVELRQNSRRQTGRERFQVLLNYVEQNYALTSDSTEVEDVFNVLINLRHLDRISESIRNYMCAELPGIEITETPQNPVGLIRVRNSSISRTSRNCIGRVSSISSRRCPWAFIYLSLALLLIMICGIAYKLGKEDTREPLAGPSFLPLNSTETERPYISSFEIESTELVTSGFSPLNNSTDVETATTETTQQVTKPTHVTPFSCQELKHLPKISVAARSAAECIHKMRNITGNFAISLILDANQSFDLEMYLNTSVGKLNELNVERLKVISPNLRNIILPIMKDKMCLTDLNLVVGANKNATLFPNNTKAKIPNSSFALPHLKALRFQGFDPGGETFTQLASSTKTNSIEKISFINSSIDKNTFRPIKKIWRQNRQALKSIKFYETPVSSNIFSKSLGIFPLVTRLEIDECTLASFRTINRPVCRSIPNLKAATCRCCAFSKNALRLCKHLEHFETDSIIPANETIFNVSAILSRHKSVKSGTIVLHSQGCKNGKQVRISGIRNLPEKVTFLTIKSLCRLVPLEEGEYEERSVRYEKMDNHFVLVLDTL